MALTRRQREVLDVIRDFISRNGYSPSLEEIGTSLGLSSVATVHKHVSHLVEKGFVRRVWNQNRSIELVRAAEGSGLLELPLTGTIAAGAPVESTPGEETVGVPAEMVAGRGRAYVLRVRGPSMSDEQIRDGDLLIVEDRGAARDGETVVALLDGAEATLRRIFREGHQVRLQPAADGVAPLVVPAERVRVHGVVVGVIRRY